MRKPVFQQRLYSKQKSNHVCHFLYICRSNGGQGPRLLSILQHFLSVYQHFRFLLHKYHFEHIASPLAVRNKNLLTYCALHTNIHCFKNSKMKPEVLIACVYIHIYIQKYIHIYVYPLDKVFSLQCTFAVHQGQVYCCTCKTVQLCSDGPQIQAPWIQIPGIFSAYFKWQFSVEGTI